MTCVCSESTERGGKEVYSTGDHPETRHKISINRQALKQFVAYIDRRGHLQVSSCTQRAISLSAWVRGGGGICMWEMRNME
jgi:hypothetical protein